MKKRAEDRCIKHKIEQQIESNCIDNCTKYNSSKIYKPSVCYQPETQRRLVKSGNVGRRCTTQTSTIGRQNTTLISDKIITMTRNDARHKECHYITSPFLKTECIIILNITFKIDSIEGRQRQIRHYLRKQAVSAREVDEYQLA